MQTITIPAQTWRDLYRMILRMEANKREPERLARGVTLLRAYFEQHDPDTHDATPPRAREQSR